MCGIIMIAKICKRLEWVRPYLELGQTYLPTGKRIVRLGHWSINGRYGKGTHASIITNDDAEFRVYLKTEYQNRWMKEPGKLSKINILANLAHELAHTADWEHSPAHKKLEAKLSIAFMNKLEEEGYISEEKELA
jgi:hypothetical protein